ncbi:2-deoxy-D-gluconate 3-dehydrogenase [Mesobacillus persicus]|uniref:2-deoxy-D-gluconate 3-dehydrogenase n=1 Tax=Mesobacillus persicus TaxID=930146 RepID=A0A1H8G1B5_9BACI|nr:2-dehydro-3-deoxy-D-gluconate 5-dehydrogenase KduD [Mesobacillus persicus]SEN37783.1 2-deoxy-D-gluconate 3-dehydrogenase [Mesobacillus persicus]
MNLFNLEGNVALVTGGNRGLGGAMAYGLAEAGADIAIVQRSSEETEVVERIRSLGRKCEVFSFDLSETSKIKDLVAAVVDQFGKIDILVNNAGVQKRSPAVEFSEEDWDFVNDVNSKAVFFLCQQVGKRMIEQGKGKIINLASLLSFQGGITVPAYAASKGAVAQFTKSLSNEWASKNINVNAIAPGYMATDMNTALLNNETRNRQILERIPAGRWGQPDDMVGAVIFLASNASNYINGETITIDGGWMGR